jgi:hypothetical protein
MSPVAWVLESILLWHLLVLSGVCSHPYFLELTVIVLPRTFRLDSSHLTWMYPVLGSPDMRWIIICLSAPTIGSWWSQQVIMAARHCSSWWRWWSDTLWATLIRLQLHSLSCYFKWLLLRFLCNFIDIDVSSLACEKSWHSHGSHLQLSSVAEVKLFPFYATVSCLFLL